MRNILIVGGSRGLGFSMVQGVPMSGDKVFVVSRAEPPVNGIINISIEWIKADLSNPSGASLIYERLAGQPLDAIIYNAGIWEKEEFESVSQDEILSIINVNLTSAILISQKLLPNLRRGNLKKMIFIGSTCGLDNEGSDSVIYNATKFGLRGVSYALREYLRKDHISVTCINPGSIASEISLTNEDEAIEKYSGAKIPAWDIISIIRMVMEMSPATCIKEINVPALKDTDI